MSHLLLAWRVWSPTAEEIWTKVFEVLELLIREDHPFRDFNIQQLLNISLVNKLLMICLVS